MQAIVSHLQKVGVKHVLVITPPPLDEEKRIEEGKAVRMGAWLYTVPSAG